MDMVKKILVSALLLVPRLGQAVEHSIIVLEGKLQSLKNYDQEFSIPNKIGDNVESALEDIAHKLEAPVTKIDKQFAAKLDKDIAELSSVGLQLWWGSWFNKDASALLATQQKLSKNAKEIEAIIKANEAFFKGHALANKYLGLPNNARPAALLGWIKAKTGATELYPYVAYAKNAESSLAKFDQNLQYCTKIYPNLTARVLESKNMIVASLATLKNLPEFRQELEKERKDALRQAEVQAAQDKAAAEKRQALALEAQAREAERLRIAQEFSNDLERDKIARTRELRKAQDEANRLQERAIEAQKSKNDLIREQNLLLQAQNANRPPVNNQNNNQQRPVYNPRPQPAPVQAPIQIPVAVAVPVNNQNISNLQQAYAYPSSQSAANEQPVYVEVLSVESANPVAQAIVEVAEVEPSAPPMMPQTAEYIVEPSASVYQGQNGKA